MGEGLKCQLCGKPATVHLTQIVENKIQKIDLCESCAQDKGVTDPNGFSLSDLLVPHTHNEGDDAAEMVCEQCGLSPSDFRKTGRMGCPACYEHFQYLIRPMLEQMHKGPQHTGKVPSAALGRQQLKQQISELERRLEEAVKQEAYEEAAKYRDQIIELRASAASTLKAKSDTK